MSVTHFKYRQIHFLIYFNTSAKRIGTLKVKYHVSTSRNVFRLGEIMLHVFLNTSEVFTKENTYRNLKTILFLVNFGSHSYKVYLAQQHLCIYAVN